jgi:hypothetical protein
MKKIARFFASLKLTVVLLALAMVLVFIGTLAQVDEGLYGAQTHYFKQWLVLGTNLAGHHIPLILPGGYLLGTLLLVNLVVAHLVRFQLKPQKLGLQLAHAGIIVLIAGQLATDLVSREWQMRLTEGETRSYSDSTTEHELVFISGQEVAAIPEKMLKPGITLTNKNLPFTLRVKAYWRNSEVNFRAPMVSNAPPLASNGIATNFDFSPVDEAKTAGQRNVPTVMLELAAPAGSLGTWVASGWAGDAALVGAVRDSYAPMGPELAQKIADRLVVPQTIVADGKPFTFTLRPQRIPHPFSLTLLKATHTVYPGTDIPKDFRSRVRIDNALTGERREVEISMNHPLRYGGYTYYQYQMNAGAAAPGTGSVPNSVLSVVRNPGWLTPYLGCAMVGVGLLIQFFQHLVGFVSQPRKNE